MALAGLMAAGAAAAQAVAPPRAQAQRGAAFRAVHYEVNATLSPAEHLLTARTRVDFQCITPSRNLEVELHPNLRITAIQTAEGKPVEFDRQPEQPIVVRVTLPELVNVDAAVSLTFDYSGPLLNDEFSPAPGMVLARIDTEMSFLLQPARWFPLTGFPGHRYTSVFNIAVPADIAVAGTGKASPPAVAAPGNVPQPPAATGQARVRSTQPEQESEPQRVVYTFRAEQPGTSGSFVAGNIQAVPVNAGGLRIQVYVPAFAAATASDYATSAASIVESFTDQFGALPFPQVSGSATEPHLTLVQMPTASLQGFSAPYTIFIARRYWDPRNTRLLAQLVAGQWWGNQITPSGPNDRWVTDGLARYSEGLHVESTAGREGFLRVLEDFAVGALMYEESAPVAQAGRLGLYGSDYRSVVLNKGAMIFHMLRAQTGDDGFRAILREFYSQFAGKSATLADFEQVAVQTAERRATADNAAPPLRPFFAQWLNSTGIPEFDKEYVVFRTSQGFRVIGKVKHDLETFQMPVEIKVETDGNPETTVVNVVGADSDFTIETFGRPKPNGVILDPNNHLLKSSPALRVRAAIARGEELAEQARYFEAIQHYEYALQLQRNNSLAHFRMGEALFYQKNYQAAANAFRDAQAGDLAPDYKWVEVWSHIYIGKIFDVSGQRERALNEYSKAKAINDDTGGAQAEADRWIAEPYREDAPARPAS